MRVFPALLLSGVSVLALVNESCDTALLLQLANKAAGNNTIMPGSSRYRRSFWPFRRHWPGVHRYAFGPNNGYYGRSLLLFLQTNSTNCADRLPYTQEPLVLNDPEAYVSLALRDVEHQLWRQELLLDGQQSPVATILWSFPSQKTLLQRFSNASRIGENVTWVIDPPCTGTDRTEGTWWFSNNAGFQRYGFDWEGSGSAFSADDGAWGAGSGPVKLGLFMLGSLHFLRSSSVFFIEGNGKNPQRFEP